MNVQRDQFNCRRLQRGQRFCRRPRLRVVNPSSCNTLRNDLDLGSSSTIMVRCHLSLQAEMDAVVAKSLTLWTTILCVASMIQILNHNNVEYLCCSRWPPYTGRITPMYVTLPSRLAAVTAAAPLSKPACHFRAPKDRVLSVLRGDNVDWLMVTSGVVRLTRFS
jgi:hypothetical protein